MHQGYFTMHNVKFKPDPAEKDWDKQQDCVPSDIDVLAYNPLLSGPDRVVAVSCKSWQEGFNPTACIDRIENGKKYAGREAWRGFRELCVPKWSRAFTSAVEGHTGSNKFTYWTAVTRVNQPENAELWENYPPFVQAMNGNPLRLVGFDVLLRAVWMQLSTTPAASELGRMVQLMKAAKWSVPS